MSEVEDQLDLQWKTIERQMRQSADNNSMEGVTSRSTDLVWLTILQRNIT